MADRLQDLAPGGGLAEIAHARAGQGSLANLRIVVCGHEKHRRCDPLGCELIAELDPGHSTQLNVDHEAMKPRLLEIGPEFLGRCISSGLHPRCAQESGERPALALIIADDRHTKMAQDFSHHGKQGRRAPLSGATVP
jgi:hypothetical protein